MGNPCCLDCPNSPKFKLVICLKISLCTILCMSHQPKAMSFWGSWVEKFHSSLALLSATASTGDHNSGWPQKQLLAISSYILWCRSPLTVSYSTQLSIWKKCCLIYHSLGIVICFYNIQRNRYVDSDFSRILWKCLVWG